MTRRESTWARALEAGISLLQISDGNRVEFRHVRTTVCQCIGIVIASVGIFGVAAAFSMNKVPEAVGRGGYSGIYVDLVLEVGLTKTVNVDDARSPKDVGDKLDHDQIPVLQKPHS